MISSINISSFFPQNSGTFTYDPTRPTKQTEELSFRLLALLGGLGIAGARIDVDLSTTAEQIAAVGGWQTSIKTWLTDTMNAVSTYLTQDEGSRSPLMLAAPTSLAIATESMIMLPPAILVNTVVDTIADMIHSWAETQGISREGELNRIVSKALFDESWWTGLSSSKIDRLIDALTGSLGTPSGGDSVAQTLFESLKSEMPAIRGIFDEIKLVLQSFNYGDGDEEGIPINENSLHRLIVKIASNKGLIRLISRVVVSSGGDITEEDFTLAGYTDE
jgi:hypothetical protein